MPVRQRRPSVDPTRAAQMAVAARNGDSVEPLPIIAENAARMALGNAGLLARTIGYRLCKKWDNL